MALTLSPELLAAQEAAVRQPIAEIKFGQFKADLPFSGQRLDTETADELSPSLITHSSGALCAAYIVAAQPRSYIRLTCTDPARMTFIHAAIPQSSYNEIRGVSLIERPDGDLLVAFSCNNFADNRIEWRRCDLGGNIRAGGQLTPPAGAPIVSVALLYTGSDYLAAYAKDVSGQKTIFTRRSADGATWGGETAVTLTGLTSNLTDNVFLTRATETMLWFDYGDPNGVFNIYYLRSVDNGQTWGTPSKVTAYARPDITGKRPYLLAKTATAIAVTFDEVRSALYMDKKTAGWGSQERMTPNSLHFDPQTRKLYAMCSWCSFGTKKLHGLVKIDADTWTIDKFWDNNTVPTVSNLFFEEINCYISYFNSYKGSGPYVPFGTGKHLCVLNGDLDTLTYYNFESSSKFGLEKNVSGAEDYGRCKVNRAWVDLESKRLYVLLHYSSSGLNQCVVGYFDLNHTGGPHYFHTLIFDTDWTQREWLDYQWQGDFVIDTASGIVVVSAGVNNDNYWHARLKVYSLGDNTAVIKDYTVERHGAFPKWGLQECAVLNGKIYGSITYEPNYGQAANKGICVIDYKADDITYMVPAFQAGNELKVGDMVSTTDGQLLLNCRGYGTAVWSPQKGWQLFNNDVIGNLFPGNLGDWVGPLAYDPLNRVVYAGAASEFVPFTGIIAFSTSGALSQPRLCGGEYGGGRWTFSQHGPLVTGLLNSRAAITLEPGTGALYALWCNRNNKIIWDKEAGELDVGEYLPGGSEINLRLGMDGTPDRVNFSLASGELFDQFNQTSLMSRYVKKGKRISLRLGDKVNGVNCWQPGNYEFVVTAVKLGGYQRGRPPLIFIEGEDRRAILERSGNIVATPCYTGRYPHEVIADLLTRFGNWRNDRIDVAAFDNGTYIRHQWVERPLVEILNEIAHRYSYFLRLDPATGKLAARKINLNPMAVDHSYSGHTWLDKFSPDDNFSDFTNKITIVGESPAKVTVAFAEERVGYEAGTVGWWKRNVIKRIWYSADKGRRCTRPRLESVENCSGISGWLTGKIREPEIIYQDPDQKFCDIKIFTPNLTPVLMAGISMVALAGRFPPVLSPTASGPAHSDIAGKLNSAGNMLISQVLGSIVNYQVELYAHPVGKVRQSFEASAYDLDLQVELGGHVNERRLEEPLCYSLNECQQVADFEMALAKAQRNRVRLSKVAHLQDEPGDKIRVHHPFSQVPMTIYIADLTRRVKLPDGAGGDGFFIDEIEGWKL